MACGYQPVSAKAQGLLSGPQPFAFGQGKAFADFQPYLGGEIRLLVGAIGANANYAVRHQLKCIPRFALVLDCGVATGISQPIPRGSTAWSFSNIYLNLPAIPGGSTVVLLIA